jgi:hypothetical protein
MTAPDDSGVRSCLGARMTVDEFFVGKRDSRAACRPGKPS